MTPAAIGIAGVEARIAEIEARIGTLVPQPAGASTFALPSDPQAAFVQPPDSRSVSLQASTGPTLASQAMTTPAAPGTLPAWARQLPDAAARWIPAIEAAAHEAGIEPTLLAALVRHESNFDQSTVSHAGAIGLGQLMPGTAEWLGVDPHDPHENLVGAATYLREQLDRFGSADLALAAYNAGPNRVADAGGIPQIQETQVYVRRVLDTWEQLR